MDYWVSGRNISVSERKEHLSCEKIWEVVVLSLDSRFWTTEKNMKGRNLNNILTGSLAAISNGYTGLIEVDGHSQQWQCL